MAHMKISENRRFPVFSGEGMGGGGGVKKVILGSKGLNIFIFLVF